MQDASIFRDFNPDELAALATSIAVAITKGLDNTSIAILGSLFYSMGGTLILIVRQRELLAGTGES